MALVTGYNEDNGAQLSSNRFDFLEFEKNDNVSEELTFPDVSFTPPQIAVSGGRGRAYDRPDSLAEVRNSDSRGYESFIAQANQAAQTPELSTFQVKEVIGSPGTRAGQFNYPTGIAVDSSGVLFVADSYNHRLQRITPSGDVAIIGSRGFGHGQFLSPQGVAVDQNCAFYVVEQGNHRIQKFSADGVCQLVFGRQGHKPGELRGPTSLSIAAGTGDIYVSDTGNARVQRFDREGRFIATLGSSQVSVHALGSPQALCNDAMDNLYVTDMTSHRIAQYDPTGRLAKNIFGASENVAVGTLKRFESPRSITLDNSGLLYVGDNCGLAGANPGSTGRLHVLDILRGQSLSCLSAIGRGVGTISVPGGLAVAPKLNGFVSQSGRSDVFVSDTANHRVLRFGWT